MKETIEEKIYKYGFQIFGGVRYPLSAMMLHPDFQKVVKMFKIIHEELVKEGKQE